MVLSSAITIAGSQVIAEVCLHMIADDRRTFCDPRSSAIIWKPAFTMLGSPVYQNLDDITSKTQTTDDNTHKFMEFILSSFFLEGGGEHFLNDFVCYFMKGAKKVVQLDPQPVNIDSHFINDYPVLSVFLKRH